MRKLMWFSIGFAAACGLSAYVYVDSWILPLFIGVCITCAGAVIAEKYWKSIRRCVMLLLGCAVGLVWFVLFQRFYLLPAVSLDGETMNTTITAKDYSYDTAYGSAVDGTVKLDGKTYQIRVYLNEKKDIKPGDTITGDFRMRYTAPGGKENATYHAGKSIFLLGYQRGEAEIIPQTENMTRFYSAELAYGIKKLLRTALPEDVFAFAQALLLGDGQELDYATDTAFKISGIRHIIAVSGLHVTILYSLLSFVTLRKRYFTALLAIPVLFVFAAVAGFTPSVTRACIMVGLMILAQVFNREYDSATALAFSSLVMLTCNPLVITSVSFQLSVGCVAGILLFNAPISNWLKSMLGNPKGKHMKARLKRWFITSVSVTISAMSLTTPLSAFYFGAVSIIGVVTNLLTLWVVNFVFNGLVVLCLVSLMSAKVSVVLGWVIGWPIRYVLEIAKLLSDIPLAAVYTESPYIVAWLVFVYILIAVFLLSKEKRPGVLSCCGVIGLCAALTTSWLEPLNENVRMTVLDVGQGQSIILQSEGRTYLVDCGGDSDTGTADLAAETLLSQGISRLDGIILTHADADHAGGVANLLSRVQADILVLPVTTEPEVAESLLLAADGKVLWVKEDLSITYGTTEITIFGPTFLANSNENSLCVLFTQEDCDILITGDRGTLGEAMLLRETDLPQVDVLIAGHHGSKYSTSEELLQAIQPEVVIISAGEDNPYGHPAQEMLERLDTFGCRVYRTDEDGTIVFRR